VAAAASPGPRRHRLGLHAGILAQDVVEKAPLRVGGQSETHGRADAGQARPFPRMVQQPTPASGARRLDARGGPSPGRPSRSVSAPTNRSHESVFQRAAIEGIPISPILHSRSTGRGLLRRASALLFPRAALSVSRGRCALISTPAAHRPPPPLCLHRPRGPYDHLTRSDPAGPLQDVKQVRPVSRRKE